MLRNNTVWHAAGTPRYWGQRSSVNNLASLLDTCWLEVSFFGTSPDTLWPFRAPCVCRVEKGLGKQSGGPDMKSDSCCKGMRQHCVRDHELNKRLNRFLNRKWHFHFSKWSTVKFCVNKSCADNVFCWFTSTVSIKVRTFFFFDRKDFEMEYFLGEGSDSKYLRNFWI